MHKAKMEKHLYHAGLTKICLYRLCTFSRSHSKMLAHELKLVMKYYYYAQIINKQSNKTTVANIKKENIQIKNERTQASYV